MSCEQNATPLRCHRPRSRPPLPPNRRQRESARLARGLGSATAPSSSGLRNRVEDAHLLEKSGRTAVAHRRHLAWLTFSTVERTSQVIGLFAADRLHRPPEIGRSCLVRDILHGARNPPVLDPVEAL